MELHLVADRVRCVVVGEVEVAQGRVQERGEPAPLENLARLGPIGGRRDVAQRRQLHLRGARTGTSIVRGRTYLLGLTARDAAGARRELTILVTG
ncbi:MAG: hypothetical protein ACRDNB_02745 [Gaiellaceae bacterium]